MATATWCLDGQRHGGLHQHGVPAKVLEMRPGKRTPTSGGRGLPPRTGVLPPLVAHLSFTTTRVTSSAGESVPRTGRRRRGCCRPIFPAGSAAWASTWRTSAVVTVLLRAVPGLGHAVAVEDEDVAGARARASAPRRSRRRRRPAAGRAARSSAQRPMRRAVVERVGQARSWRATTAPGGEVEEREGQGAEEARPCPAGAACGSRGAAGRPGARRSKARARTVPGGEGARRGRPARPCPATSPHAPGRACRSPRS